MRPSRFRPALTASLRRQKLNGFFIAIVSPVWRGRTIHGCRSTAAPLQTSRPRSTRPGNLAPTRDRMRAFRSPRHHKLPQDLGFVTQIRVIVHLASCMDFVPRSEKVTQPGVPQIGRQRLQRQCRKLPTGERLFTASLRSFPIGGSAFAADPLRTLVRLCRVVHCR